MTDELLTPEERFNFAVNFVLQHEGGLTDNKKDAGGITNFGISLRFLKSAGININCDEHIDENDVLALDKEKAKDIYRIFWWDKYRYESINDIRIAAKIFDMSVNMGATQSHKITQKSINRYIPNPISVDGVMGGTTIASINQLCNSGASLALLSEIRRNCAYFYTSLIDDNQSLSVFNKGWLRRAAS